MSTSHHRRARLAFRLALCCSLVVAGTSACQNGGTMFSGSADASDACGREHVAFAESKSFYLQQVAQGALLGTLGGAVLGALAASASHGDVGKGAAIGAGAGLVAGGTAGYFNARQQQAADQAALSSSIYGDISKASQEMDRATTTFAAVRNCRFAQANRIKGAFRQGTLGREQAVAELGDQKRRFDDELALARQYGAKMTEQDQQFRFAADSLVKQDPAAQQALASRAAQMGTGDYVAIVAVVVRGAPSTSAARVAALSKGQHVHGVADPATGEWHRISLEDGGSSGYVLSKYLSPATKSAAAPPAPVPATAPPVAATTRNVQVAVAATETIPEKRVAYNRSVDDAAKQSNLSFNLDQAS
ncbi:MAG TPA: SH3 domain-containing protein [Stellaceae bacterium]